MDTTPQGQKIGNNIPFFKGGGRQAKHGKTPIDILSKFTYGCSTLLIDLHAEVESYFKLYIDAIAICVTVLIMCEMSEKKVFVNKL